METQIIPFNRKAIGSVLIGFVSMFGIFLVGYGAILSIAGLLLGIFAISETKRLGQKGIILATFGIIFNCIGIFSLLLK